MLHQNPLWYASFAEMHLRGLNKKYNHGQQSQQSSFLWWDRVIVESEVLEL